MNSELNTESGLTAIRGVISRETRGPLGPTKMACQVSIYVNVCSSLGEPLNSQKNPLHTLPHPPPRSRTTTLGYLHTSPCWVTVLHCPLVDRQATPASPGWWGWGSLTALSAFPSPINTHSTQLRQRLCGEGHLWGHIRVTNGEECFSPEPFSKSSSNIHGH